RLWQPPGALPNSPAIFSPDFIHRARPRMLPLLASPPWPAGREASPSRSGGRTHSAGRRRHVPSAARRTMTSAMTPLPVISELALPLERDVFLRSLLRELAGTLQEVVGLEEAAGFISVVGQRLGEQINDSYRSALSAASLTRGQVAEVLVDLKR